MTDPDAPAGISQVLHWLVVNIPGCDVSKGDEHVEFIGSGPPEGTGKLSLRILIAISVIHTGNVYSLNTI